MTLPNLDSLLAPLLEIIKQAEKLVLSVYHSDFEIIYKDDNSPVTLADRAAETLITQKLLELLPSVPVIGEESFSEGTELGSFETFWLVDPVDGTKEFLKRNGEFTINIGLIHQGIPLLGIVSAPATSEIWAGFTNQEGLAKAFKGRTLETPIHCRRPPHFGAVVLTSRSHRNPELLEQWLLSLKNPVCDYCGSSLKLCRVAEGTADYTPRFGPTSEWDTAAAHAILRAAGGDILIMETEDSLIYGKEKLRNPFFLARGVKR